ncbi:hypothetical protein [Kitasatospora sp. NPDC059327]|uniref:hypothetical protein n=1 Tax=Kitasatospora sp. NPDC059327 TaxID=3346803 RepID=UPI0036D16A3D
MSGTTVGAAGTGPAAGSAPWSPWAGRAERAALRCAGLALALTAVGVVGRAGSAAAVAAGAFALWAAPPLEEPPRRAHTWFGRLAAARCTVLAAGSVVAAALGDPALVQVAVTAGLLIGYLLLVDLLGPQRDRVRPAHALAALAGSGLVLAVAFAPTGAGEWSRPVALTGLLAAGGGVLLALRSPSGPGAGTPEPPVGD